MNKNFFYLHPEAEKLFQNNGLNSFDAIWRADVELVDAPNIARGGWSEVGRLDLADEFGMGSFYVKRQQNFHCRLLSKPWQRIPLALREWLSITELTAAGIAALDVVCAARQHGDCDRMVLVTRALDDYQDMNSWFDQHGSKAERLDTLSAIGKIAARLHNAGFVHGCLYPKHIYINCKNGEDVRLIDFEKCKRIWTARGGLRDLDTLLRRFKAFDDEDRKVFLQAYIAEGKSGWTMTSLLDALGRSKHSSLGRT